MTNRILKRQLGFWDAVAINIGIVIGVGIFRVPADIAAHLQSPALTLGAWILGGLISLLGVLCYAELSSCLPHTGGTYVFLREAYGKPIGFLFGWMEFLVLRAGSLAGVAYIFAAYLKNFFYIGPGTEKWIAVLAILFFTLLNISGLRYGTRTQNVLSTLKVSTLILIAALIFLTAKDRAHDTTSLFTFSGPEWLGLAPALIPILWSYGGWEESTFMAGEFTDTKRALPFALIASVVLITFLYFFVNAAYLKAMPPDEIAQSKSIASDIFRAFFGMQGSAVITMAVLISAAGALNSTILTGARIPFALGQDTPKLLWLGVVDPRFDTPARSFIVNGFWASVLVLWGTFEELLFFTGFAKWLFFSLAGASVFLLRRRAHDPGSFRMIGYPWVPVLFVLVSLTLFLTTIIYAAKSAFLGLLLLAAGFPVYSWLHSKKKGLP